MRTKKVSALASKRGRKQRVWGFALLSPAWGLGSAKRPKTAPHGPQKAPNRVSHGSKRGRGSHCVTRSELDPLGMDREKGLASFPVNLGRFWSFVRLIWAPGGPVWAISRGKRPPPRARGKLGLQTVVQSHIPHRKGLEHAAACRERPKFFSKGRQCLVWSPLPHPWACHHSP